MGECKKDTFGNNWCHKHHSIMPSDAKQCHLARAQTAEGKIRRVEALHYLKIVEEDGGYDPFSHSRYKVTRKICSKCSERYPCTTIRTMNEKS